ncbi:hypothetical protein HPB50_009844 [Hyalomma asiaticum]|uniref:Uncharacterized protein n=1 Tax=Hyalomma asiaticum TaxID=266040 RepID=A0ACB7S1J3_HYAAI|nr:hypothetical protein HPB50_009844 [Hyalomma asiaticum]
MQALLEICQSEITRLGICFNVKKTALLRLAGERTKEGVVTLGDVEVSRCTEYKYLCVKLSASTDMYSLHEVKTREAGLRAQCILRRRCLWGCNRYLMVRDLWKLVHVPGLMFANAVETMSAASREWLQRRQRQVGRIALGCHGMVANEAVHGDIGWSSFEARFYCTVGLIWADGDCVFITPLQPPKNSSTSHHQVHFCRHQVLGLFRRV